MNRGAGAGRALSAQILSALRRGRRLRPFLLRLGSEVESAGGALWLVGGALRDLVEGSGARDLDLLVTGVGIEELGRILRRLPAAALGVRRVVRAGALFPVYRIFTEWTAGPIDAAPGREPVPSPPAGRRPCETRDEHEARADASRRDFTMNAILFRILPRRGGLTGYLFDPFDGVGDLRRRRIRAVGDPSERFREDPVRILRAIRLKNEREGFAIGRETRSALRREAHLLDSCPGERISAELRRSLSADPVRTLSDLHRGGILARLLPEISDWAAGPLRRTKRRYRLLEESLGRPLPEPLANAVLLSEIAEREVRRHAGRKPGAGRAVDSRVRIRLPATEAAARRLHLPDPRRIVRLLAGRIRLDRLGNSSVPLAQAEAILARQPDPDRLIALYDISRRSEGKTGIDLRAIRRKASRRPPLLSGADLVAAGIPEGPGLETILLAVREAALSGRIATREEALRLALRIATKGPGISSSGAGSRAEG
ncbi:MAG: HD domain-containing protein [Deltaproteobacteria bacterium]